jgi:hypothetical protein
MFGPRIDWHKQSAGSPVKMFKRNFFRNFLASGPFNLIKWLV